MGAHVREHTPKVWYSPRIEEQGNKKFGRFRYGKSGDYKYVDIIDGSLKGISIKIGEFDGQPTRSYEFVLVDEDGSQSIIQVSEAAAFAQSMISKLASLPVIDYISVSAYVSEYNGNFIILPSIRVVNAAGEEVKVKPLYKSTPSDEDPEGTLYLPPTKKLIVNNKEVTDKTERLDFLQDLMHVINSRLVSNPANWKIDEGPIDLPPEREKSTEVFDDVPF